MTVVRPGVDIRDWSSPVAVDSSPSPDSSNDCRGSSITVAFRALAAYLLVCHAARRENTVLLADFVLPPAAGLVLEVAVEAMYDIASAVRSGLRQVGALEVVDLNLYQRLQRLVRVRCLPR